MTSEGEKKKGLLPIEGALELWCGGVCSTGSIDLASVECHPCLLPQQALHTARDSDPSRRKGGRWTGRTELRVDGVAEYVCMIQDRVGITSITSIDSQSVTQSLSYSVSHPVNSVIQYPTPANQPSPARSKCSSK